MYAILICKLLLLRNTCINLLHVYIDICGRGYDMKKGVKGFCTEAWGHEPES